MMASAGWIKIFRSLQDNELWTCQEPFDYRSAWIDLLLMANFKDNTVPTKRGLVSVKRGEIYTSIRFLAKRWHWSPNKVRRYIGILNKLGMAHSNGRPNGTTISLVKYDFFQSERQSDGTTNETGDGIGNETTNGIGDGIGNETTNGTGNGTQQKNVKNDNNVKEDKKTEYDDASYEAQREKKYAYGIYHHVLLSASEMTKLYDEFGQSETQAAITYLDEYIEMKGYKAKSHYLAMRKWVFQALKEQRIRQQKSTAPASTPKYHGFKENEYDFSELEKKLLAN